MPKGLIKTFEAINFLFSQITDIFRNAGNENFEKLPDDIPARRRFAELFRKLNERLEAAKVQGFDWDKESYEFEKPDTEEKYTLSCEMDKTVFSSLAQRYKELFTSDPGTGLGSELPYDIDGYLATIDMAVIDSDYMNTGNTLWWE